MKHHTAENIGFQKQVYVSRYSVVWISESQVRYMFPFVIEWNTMQRQVRCYFRQYQTSVDKTFPLWPGRVRLKFTTPRDNSCDDVARIPLVFTLW